MIQKTYESAQKDFAEIRRMCMNIADGKNEQQRHAFYPELKAFIEKNVHVFKMSTRSYLLTVLLSPLSLLAI